MKSTDRVAIVCILFGGLFPILAVMASAHAIVSCMNPNTPVETGPTSLGADANDLHAVCKHLIDVNCGSSLPRCLAALHNEIYGANDSGGLAPVDLGCMLDAGTRAQAAACRGVVVCPP